MRRRGTAWRPALRHGWFVVYAVAAALGTSAILTVAPPLASAATKGNDAEHAALTLGRNELVKLGALPGRWSTSPYGGDGTGGGSSGGPGACEGLSEPGVDQNPPTVEGPYFDEKKTDVEVQEEIDVYPAAHQAVQDLKFGETSAAQQCFVQEFNQQKAAIVKGIGDGAKVGAVTAQSISIKQYDQGAAEIRLTIPIKVGAGSLSLYYDNVVIVQGRSEAVLDESDLSAPVPSDLEAAIDQAVARKL
jgi:hypothetical protein